VGELIDDPREGGKVCKVGRAQQEGGGEDATLSLRKEDCLAV